MYIFIFILMLFLFLLLVFRYIKINEKTKKYIIIIALIAISLIAGIRYNVGRDYLSYERLFYYDKFPIFPEILYWGLSYIVRQTINEFYVITIVMSFITTYYIYKALKVRKLKYNYIVLGILVFISSTWLLSFNLMRQCVSVSIFFYASIFIKERNLKKYLCYIILAMGFHISSIFLIPLYWIRYINIGLIKYIMLIIISYGIVISNIGPKLLSFITMYLPKYQNYYSSAHIFNANTNPLALGVLAKVGVSLLIIIFCYNKKDKEFQMEKNYYLYGVLFNILSISSYMYDRIGIYFSVYQILIIPYTLDKIKNKKDKKIMSFIFIILIIILYIQGTLGADKNSLMEYITIFNKRY